jgi:hypothetical protein
MEPAGQAMQDEGCRNGVLTVRLYDMYWPIGQTLHEDEVDEAAMYAGGQEARLNDCTTAGELLTPKPHPA